MDTYENRIFSKEKPMEFFRDMVNKALEDLNLHAEDTVIFYIVNMLSEFLVIENVYTDSENKEDQEPLTLMLEKALNSDQNEQIKRFKRLGDFSLFMSGFFSESLYRRIVSLDFYTTVGCISYNQLANIMKSKAQCKSFWELYHELAENFTAFVDVLSEVSEKSFMRSNINILTVYERWLRRQSLRDEKILRNEGIVPSLSAASQYIN